MASYTFDSFNPPLPPEEEDRARMEHGRLRRRMLTGNWRQDLENFLCKEVDATRRLSWGSADITKNVFRSCVSQLSVMFDQEPVISHEEAGAAEELEKHLTESGLWPMARTLQMYTVGMRECFLRLDPVGGDGKEPRVVVRVVPSDLVYGRGSHDDPDEPIELCEYRQRYTGKKSRDTAKGWEWTKDYFSIEDKNDPVFRVLSGGSGKDEEDLSEKFLGVKGGLRGDAYPFRYPSGEPFIPLTLFHAERTGSMFNPFFGVELVQGSLLVGVLWSFWKKCVKDCSWPQRWIIGARPAGGVQNTGGNTNMAYLPTDPSSLLNFESTTDRAPQVGQFNPASDPVALGEAIREYSSDLALDFGISASDVARISANPRSGYAIALSKDGVRSAQRKAEPSMRRGVLDVLGKYAAMWNTLTGSTLPTEGWGVFFPGVPLSVEERKQRIEEWGKQAELGLASPVDLYMAINNVSRSVAVTALELIALEKSRFSGAPVDPDAAPTFSQEFTATEDVVDIATEDDQPASATALNGAQVTAAQGIIEGVAEGMLPRETGINMLASFFNLPVEQARSIMGTVGGSFKAPQPPTDNP
jgi:hypothetical protein